MAKTIPETKITALEHPISALADRPAMSAQALKDYFDADPKQLCQAHNDLTDALTAPEAASQIGFQANTGITSTNLQEALDEIQQQVSGAVSGSIPNGSITTAKLDSTLQNTVSQIPTMQENLTQLQQKAQTIRPSGAQFPMMVMALWSGFDADLADELASAALGILYRNMVHDLGEQLNWLTYHMMDSVHPSAAFRAKQTFQDILADANTCREIANLPAVYDLIQKSNAASRLYNSAKP